MSPPFPRQLLPILLLRLLTCAIVGLGPGLQIALRSYNMAVPLLQVKSLICAFGALGLNVCIAPPLHIVPVPSHAPLHVRLPTPLMPILMHCTFAIALGLLCNALIDVIYPTLHTTLLGQLRREFGQQPLHVPLPVASMPMLTLEIACDALHVELPRILRTASLG